MLGFGHFTCGIRPMAFAAKSRAPKPKQSLTDLGMRPRPLPNCSITTVAWCISFDLFKGDPRGVSAKAGRRMRARGGVNDWTSPWKDAAGRELNDSAPGSRYTWLALSRISRRPLVADDRRGSAVGFRLDSGPSGGDGAALRDLTRAGLCKRNKYSCCPSRQSILKVACFSMKCNLSPRQPL